jgi:inorganic pyrophosphatase
VKSPRHDDIRSALDLPERTRRELAEFFLEAAVFEDKDAVILGWSGPEAAGALIDRSVAAFLAAR